MLNQSNQSDITVDVEQEKAELQQRRQASLERAAKLSVKEHNLKMDVSFIISFYPRKPSPNSRRTSRTPRRTSTTSDSTPRT